MQTNSPSSTSSVAHTLDGRYATSRANFVVLDAVTDPESLRLLADHLEARAETTTQETDAERLRRVASRLRLRSQG